MGPDEAVGIIEFESRAEALEACMQFNGVEVAEGRPVRLRQDARIVWSELRGSQGMGVVGNNWVDRVLLSNPYAHSSPHFDRCSNPFLGTPLVPLKDLGALHFQHF